MIWCIGSLKVFGGHQHCCRYILPTALVAVIVITSEAPAFGMLFRHLAGRMLAMEMRIPMQLVALLLAGDAPSFVQLTRRAAWKRLAVVALAWKGREVGEAWNLLAMLLAGDAPDFVQLVRRGAQRQIAVRALSCKGSMQVRVALRVAQLCYESDTPAFVQVTRRAAQLWRAVVPRRRFAGDALASV